MWDTIIGDLNISLPMDTITVSDWKTKRNANYYQLVGKTFHNIKAGSNYNAAISNEGILHTWGDNTDGRLGLGYTSDNVSVPTPVPDFIDYRVVAYDTSWYSGAAILENGDLYTWGYNYLGNGGSLQASPWPVRINDAGDTNIRFVDVKVSEYFSLGLDEDGVVYFWGKTDSYGMGNGHANETVLTPRKIVNISEKVIKMISVQIETIIVVDEIGDVYAWGYNYDGGAGVGHTIDVQIPTKVVIPNNEKVISVVSSNHSSYVLTENGNVYAWGLNSSGQLGVGDTTRRLSPTLVSDLVGKEIVGIYAMENHAAALSSTGEAYFWGRNGAMQLGLGDAPTTNHLLPTKSTILPYVTEIALGRTHGFISDIHYNIYGFGSNSYGEIGLGNTTPTVAPYYRKITNVEFELLLVDKFLSDLKYDYLEPPLEFYIFEGWYDDDQFAIRKNLGIRMPNYDVDVYLRYNWYYQFDMFEY